MDDETREVDVAEFVDGDENCVGVRFALLDNGSVDHSTHRDDEANHRPPYELEESAYVYLV